MKNRDFTRVNYAVGASIKFGNNVVMCNTDNMSLRGMYLKTDHEIPLDTPVNVTVYQSSSASIKLSAKVVRKEEHGVGLQIDNMNVSTFVQLRDVIADNTNDQSKMMEETYKMLKCIE